MSNERIENFVNHLIKLGGNRKAMAELRRCTSPEKAFEAGRYIYPFLPDDSYRWETRCYIAIAALFAMHGKNTHKNIGSCFREVLGKDNNTRLMCFLKARDDSVFYHLRQLIHISKNAPINWSELLSCLCGWNSYEKWAQNKIAKQFWSSEDFLEEKSSDPVGSVL